ncbi:MAG: hypothetical protein WCK35_07825 [Chloroflexota bacterium]|jgi:hypothetical protein
MEIDLPKTFQMRFDLNNEQDQIIAQFLQDYPWSRTQKVKEILLDYIENQHSNTSAGIPKEPSNRANSQGKV